MHDNFFPYPYEFVPGRLITKIKAGEDGTYVLHSSTSSQIGPKFAVALSSNVVKIYDAQGKFEDEYVHENQITDIKYDKKNPFCLFTSSLDGNLRYYDSRCQSSSVQTYKDDTEGKAKPLTCFDCEEGYYSYLLCAGTEIYREEAYILFWDQRTSDLLGGYWHSHKDDITKVRFLEGTRTRLATASLDGLINIFDLYETSEEDAVQFTLNAESAINTICWKDRGELIAAITSMDEFQIWEPEESEIIYQAKKSNISSWEAPVDYMIDNLTVDYRFYLATGTHGGQIHLWNVNANNLVNYGLVLNEHSNTVRTVCYTGDKEKIMVSGGEDGCVCLWNLAND